MLENLFKGKIALHMFWADSIAQELKGMGPQLVDDAKTPSGKIHVGALRGVIIHDLVFRALKEAGNKARFTYIIDNFDPMDGLPTYLDQEKYGPEMGKPLKDVPSPDGSSPSYSDYYAQDFIKVMDKLGAKPEIIWMFDVYKKGLMNDYLKLALDSHEKIQKIYKDVSGSAKSKDWYPFSPVCDSCGKIGTTKTVGWDGKEIEYECSPFMVEWAKGCGHRGKKSPFDGNGKMPWKVEWPARMKALGVTVEGEGKDHASKGGSRDIANHLIKEIFGGEPPYDIPYEHFLYGGKKMSSSKGIGATAEEVANILPPEILRFLMTRTKYGQAIDFDPSQPDTIPKLFDEYDRCSQIFWQKIEGEEELARAYELSQISEPQNVFVPRFSLLVNWVQMPNVDEMEEAAKVKTELLTDEDKKAAAERIKYVKIWLEKFAPAEVKFSVKENLPEEAKQLTDLQKKLLGKMAEELDKTLEAEELQNKIYELGQELGLKGSESFQAVYLSLLGKNHGPKAGWLIASLDKDFVAKRFKEV